MNYTEMSDFDINKAVERFNEKWTESDNGCHEWIFGVNKKGYGFFWFVDRTHQAHRVSFFLSFGAFDNSLYVCHSCDNPSCVNPSHLFLGSAQDNANDMLAKGRGADACGSKNNNAKLSSSDLTDITARLNNGETATSIAALYGVHQTTISRVKAREAWS